MGFEEEESWFTLDNRRLYCLQQAAVRLLPERCTADTTIEIRKERRLREVRKFRTLDNGSSINVGSVVDGVPFTRWSWLQRAKNNETGKGKNGAKGSEAAGGGQQKGKGKGRSKGKDGKGGDGQKGKTGNSEAHSGKNGKTRSKGKGSRKGGGKDREGGKSNDADPSFAQ